MVALPTVVTTLQQWVQLRDALLHEYGLNCHTNGVVTMVTVLALHVLTLSRASFESTSEF